MARFKLKPRTLTIVAVGLVAVGLGLYWAWTGLGTWLARSDGLRESEVIVCLSSPERIQKTARLFHQKLAPRVILTVATDKKALTDLGVPADRITLAPGPLTTWQEALAVAPILQREGYLSGLVVTDPYHLRRVRWTFGQVLKNHPVSLAFVATDLPWAGQRWWRYREEKLRVYSEVSKLAWYWLSHGLLRMDDDPPWAIELKHRYQRWLTDWVEGEKNTIRKPIRTGFKDFKDVS